VHKHFGTKKTLQISTLDKAFVDFWHRVVEPALAEHAKREAIEQAPPPSPPRIRPP